MIWEGIRVTPAQAETLNTLTQQFGTGKLVGFQKGEGGGPLCFNPKTEEDEHFVLLTNGDLLRAPNS